MGATATEGDTGLITWPEVRVTIFCDWVVGALDGAVTVLAGGLGESVLSPGAAVAAGVDVTPADVT